ncbi:glycosyl transferase family 90-domain-containing protein [Obelidium mucronatum]|nr:glycosyl transferase family 90-domain-containing protein [Obelidium mucronatum]
MRITFAITKPERAFKAFLFASVTIAAIIVCSAWILHVKPHMRITDYAQNTEESNDYPPRVLSESSILDAGRDKARVGKAGKGKIPEASFNITLSKWQKNYVQFRSQLSKSEEVVEPPPKFEKWVAFAESKKCLFGLEMYAQIYKDLAPFIANKTAFTTNNLHSIPGIEVGRLDYEIPKKTWLGYFFPKWNPPKKPRLVFSMGNTKILNGIVDLNLFDKPFEYAYNARYDEPQMLPSESSSKPYGNWSDIYENSECARMKFDVHTPENYLNETSLRESHGFMMAPHSFNVKNGKIPVMSQAKADCFYDIVVPMDYPIKTIVLGPVNDTIPWSKKRDVLFWRGASSGGRYDYNHPWDKYHRTRLLEWERSFASKYPKNVFDAGKVNVTDYPRGNIKNRTKPEKTLSWLSVDIGLNKVVQADEVTAKELERKYTLKAFVPFNQTVEFKYLLVVDGNTWPARLSQYLETNSIVLLSTAVTDWFMWMLVPFVHYVPVAVDLSDLEDRLRWLRENDDKAQIISANARQLAKKINRMGQLQCYSGLLMMEYSRLYHEANPEVRQEVIG